MSASVVTWNCNSLRSRLNHLLELIDRVAPDVVLLQELKLEDAVFPFEQIEEKGYNCAIYGQKSYNGVAILSRSPFDEVRRGLGMEGDDAARLIEADLKLGEQLICIASIYVPNGQSVDSDKFTYKMRFFEALSQRTEALLRQYDHVILGGDYNIAPRPIDVYDAKSLDGSICYHPAERAALRRIRNQGYSDAWENRFPDRGDFTWWDYRQNAFERHLGLRIDHLLCSPEAADRLEHVEVLIEDRQKERPSDHAPVLGRFAY